MRNRLNEALGFIPDASNYLYALCDYQTLLQKDLYLLNFVQLVQKLDVKLIQYRDKINSFETQIENLTYLKKHLDIPILVNDKIELIAYADGVHLGQEDLEAIHKDKKIAISLVRKKIGNKLLGLSTHNEMEILESNDLDIDMIGLGAYKSTSTKEVSNILGNKIIYLAKMAKHPVCAIGNVAIEDKIENITFNVVGSKLYEN